MTHSVVSIDHLKQQILPELFAFPARLGEYGGVADSSAKIDQLSDLMESGSAAALAAKIAEILSKMADASPEQSNRLANSPLSTQTSSDKNGWKTKPCPQVYPLNKPVSDVGHAEPASGSQSTMASLYTSAPHTP